MDINKLLDNAKKSSALRNDTALAEKLGVTRSAVYNYRHAVSLPDAVICAKLADMTGEPLARVLGMVNAERAISSAEKAVWKRLASAACVVLVLAATPDPAQAYAGGAAAAAWGVWAVRIMSRMFRRSVKDLQAVSTMRFVAA